MFVPNHVKFTHSICLSVTAGVGLLYPRKLCLLSGWYTVFTLSVHLSVCTHRRDNKWLEIWTVCHVSSQSWVKMWTFSRMDIYVANHWHNRHLCGKILLNGYPCKRQFFLPASVAQLDAPSDWRPGGRGFNPGRGRQHFFLEIDREIFSTVILSLPLIQEGQLSVSGERMCTILVNRLED